MTVDEFLFIIEKIDLEIRDGDTVQQIFQPLWKLPFLRETFKDLLEVQSCVRLGHMNQDDLAEHKKTFENVCRLLCPEFVSTLDLIEEKTVV